MSSPRRKVVVLGAGVTGLGAAYRLSKNPHNEVHVVERETTAGGVCRSFRDGDFILDYGPHKFYSLLAGITEEVKDVMGDDFLERDKKQSLYMNGRYYDFPLKMSEMLLRFPLHKSAKVLSSFMLQTAKNHLGKKDARTYEEFIVERFGRGLYGEIFEPMAKKIYGDPAMLDRKLAEVRISSPGLVAVIKDLLLRKKIDRGTSAPVFHYPKYGFGMIPDRFKELSERNGAQFHLGAKVLNIDANGGKVRSVLIENARGETQRIECDHLIYTIPLASLQHLIKEELPSEIRKAASSIASRHVIIQYYLVKSRPLLPSMWVFFPESKFRFGRLSEMIKFSPHAAPPGYTSLMVDFTCEDHDPMWNLDETQLGRVLLEQLKPLKLFDPSQVVKSFSKRFRNFYPIYQLGYQDNLLAIRRLEALYQNLFFIGRLGDFNYNNSDQCLDMGFRAAAHIESEGQTGESWALLREKTFEHYRIVD